MHQGNVVFSHNSRYLFFQMMSNTKQIPLNIAYNADSLWKADHLCLPLMMNLSAMPKMK